MRLRLILLLVLVGILLVANGIKHKNSVKAQGLPVTRNVYLGGAVLQPNSIPVTGSSTFIVSVATGAEVPSLGDDGATPIRAVVQVVANSNASGINYTVTPSQLVSVNLAGGGNPSTPDPPFTVTIDSQNTKGGSITYQATLVRLENATGLAQASAPQTMNATLTVSPTPTPTPTPTPPTTQSACIAIGWHWSLTNNTCTESCPTDAGSPLDCEQFAQVWCDSLCRCTTQTYCNNNHSPIIIDLSGKGFDLTDAQHGVNFDLDGDGFPEQVSWTAANSDVAFLFLDRNGDGRVNNGIELFGDVTPQLPPPPDILPNGFNALAMYDRPGYFGGNGDGVIDSRDAVFSQLRLWQDRNHNGITDPDELHTLPELGIESISLDYRESPRRDRYGNEFRYRAKVYGKNHTDLGRWAYDVFLVPAQ